MEQKGIHNFLSLLSSILIGLLGLVGLVVLLSQANFSADIQQDLLTTAVAITSAMLYDLVILWNYCPLDLVLSPKYP